LRKREKKEGKREREKEREKGRRRGEGNETKGTLVVATRDASGTSEERSGERGERGGNEDAEANENESEREKEEEKREASPGRLGNRVRNAGSYRLAIKVDGDNNGDIPLSLHGFL